MTPYAPAQAPPTGGGWVHVSADGRWYWDGWTWRATYDNATTLQALPTTVTPDGMWWWAGYAWAPTPAALAFWESERRRRTQSWLTIAAAALFFLR